MFGKRAGGALITAELPPHISSEMADNLFSSLDDGSFVVEFEVCLVETSGVCCVARDVFCGCVGGCVSVGVAGNNCNSNPVPNLEAGNLVPCRRSVEQDCDTFDVANLVHADVASIPVRVEDSRAHSGSSAGDCINKGPYSGGYKGGLWNGHGFFRWPDLSRLIHF